MTFPLTVILLPSHSVGHTRGKVFKLNLKGRWGERQKEGKETLHLTALLPSDLLISTVLYEDARPRDDSYRCAVRKKENRAHIPGDS